MTDGPTSEQLDETPDVRLAAEHDQLAGLVSALEHEGLDVEPESTSIGELAAAGQHPADLASETFDRERDLALLNEFRAELDANEDAADRLAAGCYGWCEDCHRPIDLDRLAAVPATSRCKACQDRFEFDSFLTDGPAGPLPIQPDDLSEYLPDDEAERPAVLEPEEAALHIEG
jgi:RNA polymerase-binding transcription factor DksA